jgi:Capsid protein (F protein).
MGHGLGDRHNQHSFAQTPQVNMARSQFDRSHGVKDTWYVDELTPFFVDEIIPGDTCNLNVNSFIRTPPLVHPLMDNLYVDFFFFFVPNRLLWTNWEKFCGAQDNPGDSIDYTIPTIPVILAAGLAGSIFDKMGIPSGIAAPGINVNALPFRAYRKIWNEWFRDQNLQNTVSCDLDNGPDTMAENVIRFRNKRPDYFTTCLPAPQRGTAVAFPTGVSAPVLRTASAAQWTAYNAGTQTSHTTAEGISTAGSGVVNAANTFGLSLDPGASGLYANLAGATAITINQVREAFQVQSILELDARGGTRYVEILQSHYNVTSPDFRLQRSEYLGGGSTRINSHPVAQTSPTSGANAMGNLGAFATASTSGGQIGFTKSFVEHGYVIGIACARGEITYQQGIDRMWLKSTRYDIFWPKLQQLGEQSVTKKEIYVTGTTALDNVVFGYQERYAEYRYKPSKIRGEFNSTFATPLDSWHLAEKFASTPTLGDVFITSTTPMGRALSIDTGPDLLVDLWLSYKHARPMMTYSIPIALGRF